MRHRHVSVRFSLVLQGFVVPIKYSIILLFASAVHTSAFVPFQLLESYTTIYTMSIATFTTSMGTFKAEVRMKILCLLLWRRRNYLSQLTDIVSNLSCFHS